MIPLIQGRSFHLGSDRIYRLQIGKHFKQGGKGVLIPFLNTPNLPKIICDFWGFLIQKRNGINTTIKRLIKTSMKIIS